MEQKSKPIDLVILNLYEFFISSYNNQQVLMYAFFLLYEMNTLIQTAPQFLLAVCNL